MNAMTHLFEKLLQFFFHRIAAVIGPNCNCLALFRTAAGNSTDDFNAAIVHDFGSERRQSRGFGDTKSGPAPAARPLVFLAYYLFLFASLLNSLPVGLR